jgi:hypothetical protein
LAAGKLKKKEAFGTESFSSPAVDQVSGMVSPVYEVKGPILGKIILFVGLAVLLGGIAFGGWWIYMRYFSGSSTVVPTDTTTVNEDVTPADQMPVESVVTNTLPDNTEATMPTEVNTSSDIGTEINNDKILFGEQVDSDRDGLDDVREKELGTDPSNVDTDGDGLSDNDEVIFWKTDPIKFDTDEDGYNDGQEVRAGYNPLGAGKLTTDQAPVTSTASVDATTL